MTAQYLENLCLYNVWNGDVGVRELVSNQHDQYNNFKRKTAL